MITVFKSATSTHWWMLFFVFRYRRGCSSVHDARKLPVLQGFSCKNVMGLFPTLIFTCIQVVVSSRFQQSQFGRSLCLFSRLHWQDVFEFTSLVCCISCNFLTIDHVCSHSYKKRKLSSCCWNFLTFGGGGGGGGVYIPKCQFADLKRQSLICRLKCNMSRKAVTTGNLSQSMVGLL